MNNAEVTRPACVREREKIGTLIALVDLCQFHTLLFNVLLTILLRPTVPVSFCLPFAPSPSFLHPSHSPKLKNESYKTRTFFYCRLFASVNEYFKSSGFTNVTSRMLLLKCFFNCQPPYVIMTFYITAWSIFSIFYR